MIVLWGEAARRLKELVTLEKTDWSREKYSLALGRATTATRRRIAANARADREIEYRQWHKEAHRREKGR